MTIVPVVMYEDARGRRFINVESDYEPPPITVATSDIVRPVSVLYRGRRVQIADLLEAGYLLPGEALEFRRRSGAVFRATVDEDGSIRTEDGRSWPSPSRAAMEAANLVSYDGWYAWQVPRLGGSKLAHLRRRLVSSDTQADDENTNA